MQKKLKPCPITSEGLLQFQYSTMVDEVNGNILSRQLLEAASIFKEDQKLWKKVLATTRLEEGIELIKDRMSFKDISPGHVLFPLILISKCGLLNMDPGKDLFDFGETSDGVNFILGKARRVNPQHLEKLYRGYRCQYSSKLQRMVSLFEVFLGSLLQEVFKVYGLHISFKTSFYEPGQPVYCSLDDAKNLITSERYSNEWNRILFKTFPSHCQSITGHKPKRCPALHGLCPVRRDVDAESILGPRDVLAANTPCNGVIDTQTHPENENPTSTGVSTVSSSSTSSLSPDGIPPVSSKQVPISSSLCEEVLATNDMANDLSTNDLATNDLGTNDLGTNDLDTNDLGTNDMGTNDLDTNDLGTNDMGTNDLVTTNQATKDLATINLGTKDLATTNLGTKDLATNDLGTKDLVTTNLATKDSDTINLATKDLATNDLATNDLAIVNSCAVAHCEDKLAAVHCEDVPVGETPELTPALITSGSDLETMVSIVLNNTQKYGSLKRLCVGYFDFEPTATKQQKIKGPDS